MTGPVRGEGDGVSLGPRVHVPEGVLRFTYASASGPGGQNVNKRLTKAVLRVRVEEIPMSAAARARLRALGGAWLTGDESELVIASDEHRSQSRNRESCVERLRALVVRALVPPRKRVATRPSRSSVERRLESKRREGERKRGRGGTRDGE